MPHMVTFPLDHPLRPAVEASLGVGAFVAVAAEGKGPRNCCHRNVDLAIAQRGGRGVVGWQIDWWPKLFVRALPHAIVERNGVLVDVTSTDPEDRATATTFAPVEVIEGSVQAAVPAMLPSKYFVIADTPEVHEMIAAAEAQREIKIRLDRAMIEDFGFTDDGEVLIGPDAAAERAFLDAHGDEMVQSIRRVDRALAACEALAARLP